MNAVQSLVPARFLVLMAHLVLVVTLFWSLDETVISCMPPSELPTNFTSYRIELIVAFSLTLFLFLIELIGFSSGLTMFSTAQALLSIGAHAGAIYALSDYVIDSTYCRFYWYIFAFGSILPCITEISIIVSILWLKMSV